MRAIVIRRRSVAAGHRPRRHAAELGRARPADDVIGAAAAITHCRAVEQVLLAPVATGGTGGTIAIIVAGR